MYDECIAEIQRAGGGKLTEADLRDILGDILRRKNRRANPGMTAADRILQVANEYGRDLAEAEAIVKRNAYENALKRTARRGVQAAAPTPDLGIEAGLVGVNSPFAGNRDSVDAVNRALLADWLGGLNIDLRRAGLEKYAASGMDDLDIARELSELNKVDGEPGITGNERAKSTAAVLHRYQSAAMATENRSGAWVKPYYGYVARTIHDAEKVRGLRGWDIRRGRLPDILTGRMPPEEQARAAWVKFALDNLNLEETFGSREAALKALPQEWAAFASGKHLDGINEDEANPFANVGPNQGRRASSARVYVWKSAEHWQAYNARFGAGSVTAAVGMSLRRSARISALLQKFGTNPTQAFEADLLHWKQQLVGHERKAALLDKNERKLRNQLAIVDGSASIPANAVSNARLQAWLRGQRYAKLGSAALTSLWGDMSQKASELRYQGVPFLDRWRTMLSDYLGRHAMAADQKEAADLLKAGLDSSINDLAQRYEVGVSRPGLGTTIDNLFFKYTGLSGITDNRRLGAQMIMARWVGRQKGKAISELPRGLRTVLEGVGIGNQEWDLLRSGDWKEVGKRDFFEPTLVNRLDPDRLAAYASSRGRSIEDVKADLSQRILTYIHDRGIYAVLEPTARTRATMTQGHQPGTLPGNAIRMLGQFKAFSVAMLQQTWGREIYGGAQGADRLAGVAELMISSLILGYASMSMRDFLYGRTPRDPRDPQTIAAAFAAGGGLSIYGDFLFGSWSRYGASAGDSLLGPTFGQFSSAMDIYSGWKEGDTGLADAFKMLKQNVPGQNIWMTRTALDHYLIFRIQEALSPGYLQRMEDRVRQLNNGNWLLRVRQDWWLRPTTASAPWE
jgi:hypothetical protein